MPLVIGDINATITVLPPKPVLDEEAPEIDLRATEIERARALSALRLDAERQIEQRDPDLLGGQ